MPAAPLPPPWLYAVQATVDIGVPAGEPPIPTVQWWSYPMLTLDSTTWMRDQVDTLLHAMQAGFQTRQAMLQQPYPDMPALGIFMRHHGVPPDPTALHSVQLHVRAIPPPPVDPHALHHVELTMRALPPTQPPIAPPLPHVVGHKVTVYYSLGGSVPLAPFVLTLTADASAAADAQAKVLALLQTLAVQLPTFSFTVLLETLYDPPTQPPNPPTP